MDLVINESELAAWLLILARLLGWSWMDPVICRLPWMLRLFFAGALAWVWVPGASVTVDPLTWPGLILFLEEFLLGALLGLIIRIYFAVASVALQTLGLTVSMGLTQVVPEQQSGLEWPLQQLAFWLALMAFVSANGHGLVIQALSSAFDAMPVAVLPAQVAARQIYESGSMLLTSGLQLALPMLVLVLLFQFAFAMLSRMLPSVEAISVGLALGSAALLAALAMAVPLMLAGLGKVLERFPDTLRLLIP